MKKPLVIILAVFFLCAAGFAAYKIFFEKNQHTTNVSKVLYTCAMHPQIISDHPGVCPICGMDLILKKNDTVTDNTEATTKNINEITLSPSQQVLANLQTEKVQSKSFGSDMELNGYVKYNEGAMRHISTPVSGNILKQYITFEGQYVRAGDRAFDLYSPEMYSTQKEYLLAVDNLNRSEASGNAIVIEQAMNLISATKMKLKLLQLSDNQIRALEKNKDVKNFITIYTKFSGIITKKYAHEGHWAAAGEDIYDVNETSNLWVIANVNEADIRFVRRGLDVTITAVSYPGEEFYGKVDFINPSLQADSRTLEARITVPNRNNRLMPDMFVKVKINTGEGAMQQIAVPVNAVVRTGKMDMVYIKTSGNTFAPRNVIITGERDGYYIISSGISEGEEIVSSAGFLLDSESQIRSGSSSNDMPGMDMKNKNELKVNPDQDAIKDMKK